VVNWNAGNTTLTHSANQLQVEPANFVVYRNSLSIVTIGDPPNLGFPGIWFGVTPASATYSNYSFLYDLFNGPIFNAASTFSLQFRINNVTQVVLDANGKWRPSSNGGSSLGISGTAWSDLWLASAGKISFNADDVTITHSSNALAFTGASSGYSFDSNVGIGATTPDRKLHVENDSATTNAVSQVFRMTSTSSGTPATGIGVGMEFEVETAAGNNEVGATINAVTTDVTSTSEDFDLVFNTMAAGATAAERMRVLSTGAVTIQGVATVAAATATPAAGSTSARLLFGTTAGFGIYYGSGAPTVSAAQGSLYLRSDGSTTTTRMYVNTNGSTTWTNLITTA
jgi:hypothetical protein